MQSLPMECFVQTIRRVLKIEVQKNGSAFGLAIWAGNGDTQQWGFTFSGPNSKPKTDLILRDLPKTSLPADNRESSKDREDVVTTT